MKRDPRAVWFNDWWGRNRFVWTTVTVDTPQYGPCWFDAFDLWTQPLALDPAQALQLFDDAADEYHERVYMRSHLCE